MVLTDLSYLYPVFPIIGSIGVVLCLTPVPLHWRSGNIAIVSVSLWSGIGLLIFVINSCIWHGNIRNPYPIWGDITQVVCLMVPPAISSCMFFVQYQLWNIARMKSVFISRGQKRKHTFWAFFFCLGLPLIIAALHSVVQGHRYTLIEDLGPWFTTYNVTLAFPLYYMWDPILCVAAGLYAIHTVVILSTQRKELDIALNSGATRINRTRYIRLVGIAFLSTCINLPLSFWPIVYNATAIPVYPWISWEDTHSNYHRIEYVTRLYLSMDRMWATIVSTNLWTLVGYNYCLFIFFGLGDDAILQYRSWLRACLKPFGIELLKDERKKVKQAKRSWLDVLLRRPIRPTFTDSFPRNRQRPQSTLDMMDTQPSISGNHIVESHVGTKNDDLIPGALRSNIETRVSASIYPDQIERTGTGISDKDLVHTVPIVEKSRMSGEAYAETLNTPKVEGDIEVQVVSTSELEAQRRREILERNPELTEEMTF